MTVKEQCLEIIDELINECDAIDNEKYNCASCILEVARLRINKIEEPYKKPHTFQIIRGEGIDN